MHSPPNHVGGYQFLRAARYAAFARDLLWLARVECAAGADNRVLRRSVYAGGTVSMRAGIVLSHRGSREACAGRHLMRLTPPRSVSRGARTTAKANESV